MSEYGPNKSFVLKAIKEVVFEERPVPEGNAFIMILFRHAR